jgi:hypothetical protein
LHAGIMTYLELIKSLLSMKKATSELKWLF